MMRLVTIEEHVLNPAIAHRNAKRLMPGLA